MDILFNRDNNSKASTELKELLSFLDIDLKYEKMQSDIISATREVINLIGSDIYAIAYTDYSTKADLKKDLVFHIRYAIAIKAYRMLAPNIDLAHTNNGRKMRQDDNQKQAFEWMIDRDNESLERKYYRALDDLLHYLEETEPTWKNSDAYKKLQESIFKTTADFDEHFSIKSRLTLLNLLPGIKLCLQHEIKVRVGSEVLENIINENVAPDQVELQFAVKQACAYYALAWAMPRLSIQLFPEGILQPYVGERATTQSKQVASGMALAFAKENFEKDFKKAIASIETIMKASQPSTPEDFVDATIKGSNFIST